MEIPVENSDMEEHERLVMRCAIEAGHILLENGAEIGRVEETMDRICHHFHVDNSSFFVLSNGLFAADESGQGGHFADVRHIPVHGARLDRVAAVNQVSREMEEGRLNERDLYERLKAIRVMEEKPVWQRIIASGIGSACFCVIFGGSGIDAIGSFMAGFILYIYTLLLVRGRLSKLMYSISGGALVTAVSLICYHIGIGESLSSMIVGSVIPLVPGVAFTNGIRDIGNEDYIAGAVRLIDASMVFLGIATGVGFVTMLSHLTGGI